jgi:hypothetical protein
MRKDDRGIRLGWDGYKPEVLLTKPFYTPAAKIQTAASIISGLLTVAGGLAAIVGIEFGLPILGLGLFLIVLIRVGKWVIVKVEPAEVTVSTDSVSVTRHELDTDDTDHVDGPFRPPDEDFDYEAAAENWTAELAQTEVELTPSDETGEPPSYRLKEPETDTAVDTVRTALLEADRFRFVAAIVDQPPMTQERWHNDLTAAQRGELHQLCADFVHANQLVGGDAIEEAQKNRQSNR